MKSSDRKPAEREGDNIPIGAGPGGKIISQSLEEARAFAIQRNAEEAEEPEDDDLSDLDDIDAVAGT